ncbi:hypothetical protein PR048_019787 [Dryococelus australis]|uniref:Uncharacterized protein n=1 Tax=Dryococelus australis TaxID=614101 RepID=A0ABQ9H4G0_9NEOP|nr:hypothetical protein PR048_019787 [Dryococelus australis]
MSQIGATVAERLARSPFTKANRVQSPAGLPDFRKWESCRTMPLVGVFSRGEKGWKDPMLGSFRSSLYDADEWSLTEAVESKPQVVIHDRLMSDAAFATAPIKTEHSYSYPMPDSPCSLVGKLEDSDDDDDDDDDDSECSSNLHHRPPVTLSVGAPLIWGAGGSGFESRVSEWSLSDIGEEVVFQGLFQGMGCPSCINQPTTSRDMEIPRVQCPIAVLQSRCELLDRCPSRLPGNTIKAPIRIITGGDVHISQIKQSCRVTPWGEPYNQAQENNTILLSTGFKAELKAPDFLALFCTFEAEMRRLDKGDTATHIKCAIATKRKALNCRVASSSHCVYGRDNDFAPSTLVVCVRARESGCLNFTERKGETARIIALAMTYERGILTVDVYDYRVMARARGCYHQPWTRLPLSPWRPGDGALFCSSVAHFSVEVFFGGVINGRLGARLKNKSTVPSHVCSEPGEDGLICHLKQGLNDYAIWFGVVISSSDYDTEIFSLKAQKNKTASVKTALFAYA